MKGKIGGSSLEAADPRFREANSHQNVGEVMLLPFESFAEVQQLAKDGKLAFAVAPQAATDLNVKPQGRDYVLWLLAGSSLYLLSLVLIVLSLWTHNYWLLLGVAALFVGSVFGYPGFAGHAAASRCIPVVIIVAAASVAAGYHLLGGALAAGVYAFFAVRLVNRLQVKTMLQYALRSEPLFLFLYERNGLQVVDRRDARLYANNARGEWNINGGRGYRQ